MVVAPNFVSSLCSLVIIIAGGIADGADVFSNTWVVEFNQQMTETQVDAFAKYHGFINLGKVIHGLEFYEFAHPEVPEHSLEPTTKHEEKIKKHPLVKDITQQTWYQVTNTANIRSSNSRMTLTDPSWSDTWYLNELSTDYPMTMNVISAWERGYSGKGVLVSVVDDGVDYTHPDLQAHYDYSASYDVVDKDNDPFPLSVDRYMFSPSEYELIQEMVAHGTRCAGEIVATANNSYCSVGVAYGAKFGGIRLLKFAIANLTSAMEAKALAYNMLDTDIYSCSYGESDDGKSVTVDAGLLREKAMEQAINTGRSGKGVIYVFASGNGGGNNDSCACSSSVVNIYTIAVASVMYSNVRPFYSERCSAIMVSSYSSTGNDSTGVVTTDLEGRCAENHSGTSASTPLVAGIIALVLEANAELTWRDIQYITMVGANNRFLRSDGDFTMNAAGKYYSYAYGFGLIDADKMIDLALVWKQVGNQLKNVLPAVYTEYFTDTRAVSYDIDVPACYGDDCLQFLEHVQLRLTAIAPCRGGLSVYLTSPRNTKSTLLFERNLDNSTDERSFTQWPFMSLQFWGEKPEGVWKLEVKYNHEATKCSLDDTGALVFYYQLILYGVAEDAFQNNIIHISCSSNNTGLCLKTDSCNAAETDKTECYTCGSDQFFDTEKRICTYGCLNGTCNGFICRNCENVTITHESFLTTPVTTRIPDTRSSGTTTARASTTEESEPSTTAVKDSKPTTSNKLPLYFGLGFGGPILFIVIIVGLVLTYRKISAKRRAASEAVIENENGVNTIGDNSLGFENLTYTSSPVENEAHVDMPNPAPTET